jgi:hypothetical protein
MKPPILSLAAKFPGIAVFIFLFSGSALPQQLISAKAGMVQFLVGEAYIDGTALRLHDGQYFQLENGQLLRTGKGYAELLLAPDACLRLGKNASLIMRQNELADIRLGLDRGSAIIEILKKLDTDPIRVHISKSIVEIKKEGLYRLDAESRMLRVYGGDARAIKGKKNVRVKSGRRVVLSGEPRPEKFDARVADTLHRWAAQRSFALFTKSLFFVEPVYPGGLAWKSRPEGLYNPHYRITVAANEDWNRYWLGVWSVFRRRAEEMVHRRRTDPESLLTPEQRKLVDLPKER